MPTRKPTPVAKSMKNPPASHVGILPRGYAPYRPTLREAR